MAMGPRLRAVRQLLRSVGNWAAGQYQNPISRAQLRDSLLEQLRAIFGPGHPLPSAARLEQILAGAGEAGLDAPKLIRSLRLLVESTMPGGRDAEP